MLNHMYTNSFKRSAVGKWARASAAVVLMAGAMACGTDGSATAPTANLKTLPWKLTLNHHGITSLVNTPVQLSYVVTNVAGEVLTGLPPVVYTTSDTSVKVDEQGRLTGSTYSTLRYVYATITDSALTWKVADTIRVAFDTIKPDFATVRMAYALDTVVPLNRIPSFPMRMFTASGDTVRLPTVVTPPALPALKTINAYYESSAPNNVFYQGNRFTSQVNIRNIGSTVVTAEAHVYGQTYYDTLRIRSVMPDSVGILILRVSNNLNPSPSAIGQPDMTIVQGGKVNFRMNNTSTGVVPVDIRFDDLANVINGDIPEVPGLPGHVVTFPNTGKFTYRSNTLGSSFVGTITVVAR